MVSTAVLLFSSAPVVVALSPLTTCCFSSVAGFSAAAGAVVVESASDSRRSISFWALAMFYVGEIMSVSDYSEDAGGDV